MGNPTFDWLEGTSSPETLDFPMRIMGLFRINLSRKNPLKHGGESPNETMGKSPSLRCVKIPVPLCDWSGHHRKIMGDLRTGPFLMELATGVSWVIGIPHSPSMGPWGFPVHSPTIQRAGGYPHGYMETSSYGPFSIAMLDHPAYPQPPSWTAWRARGWCPCLFPLQGSADVHHPFWWWLVIPWKRWKKNWMITIYHNQLGVHTTGTWIPCSRILADPIPRGFFRGLQKTLLLVTGAWHIPFETTPNYKQVCLNVTQILAFLYCIHHIAWLQARANWICWVEKSHKDSDMLETV